MVVDDERDTVLTLTALLQDEGHMVEGVYRARDVKEAVKRFDPDVVLLDIALPDGSGYKVAEDIRRRHGPQRPPHDQLSRIVGCDHFLIKPFEIDELLGLIAPLTH